MIEKIKYTTKNFLSQGKLVWEIKTIFSFNKNMILENGKFL